MKAFTIAISLSWLALVGCASNKPPLSECEQSCGRSCDARCSQDLAQCEVRCDNMTPMDMGNTEKQQPMSRNDNPPCRRACSSEEQSCLRRCKSTCACPR